MLNSDRVIILCYIHVILIYLPLNCDNTLYITVDQSPVLLRKVLNISVLDLKVQY